MLPREILKIRCSDMHSGAISAYILIMKNSAYILPKYARLRSFAEINNFAMYFKFQHLF